MKKFLISLMIGLCAILSIAGPANAGGRVYGPRPAPQHICSGHWEFRGYWVREMVSPPRYVITRHGGYWIPATYGLRYITYRVWVEDRPRIRFSLSF